MQRLGTFRSSGQAVSSCYSAAAGYCDVNGSVGAGEEMETVLSAGANLRGPLRRDIVLQRARRDGLRGPAGRQLRARALLQFLHRMFWRPEFHEGAHAFLVHIVTRIH